MTEEALPKRVDTLVIGAGQAGLNMSAVLRRTGVEHLVVERRATLGGGWQDRWDGFRLVTPNWTSAYPELPYDGPEPDGFMPRDEIAGRIARLAEAVQAPVALDTAVTRVRQADGGRGFHVTTSRGELDADRVVSATGGFQVPRIPDGGAGLSSRVRQLHSQAYRNPGELPDGAVLVVGSGQSGVQITEELLAAGRRVYLSVGRCGRIPRTYRGRDIFVWIDGIRRHGQAHGLRLPVLADLPDPRGRFGCNPHLSGHGGGHEVNLRRLAAGGVTLLGRLEAIEGERVRLAGDLAEKLAFADAMFPRVFQTEVDAYIDATAPGSPPDDRQPFDYQPPERTELDLAREGIGTVLWPSGFRMDWSWLELPGLLDDLGVPRQDAGLAEIPGLAFIGLPWMRDLGSATLFGVRADAEQLADRMESARAAA